ncbi:hypothetical protein CXB45_00810 [Corynebacterium mastitidis]|uniref:Uncharacterized protein n=1 Tax=Corynebacterium mastitidis TaxID=161890 RepID=A0A2N0XAK8_9CORY|nr:hypothetical protein CXB45_00810 [Corynebacterium mastitidis]
MSVLVQLVGDVVRGVGQAVGGVLLGVGELIGGVVLRVGKLVADLVLLVVDGVHGLVGLLGDLLGGLDRLGGDGLGGGGSRGGGGHGGLNGRLGAITLVGGAGGQSQGSHGQEGENAKSLLHNFFILSGALKSNSNHRTRLCPQGSNPSCAHPHTLKRAHAARTWGNYLMSAFKYSAIYGSPNCTFPREWATMSSR